MEKKITLTEVCESKDLEGAIITYLAQNNEANYNVLKALEECSEFMEVLTKLRTKKPDKAPNKGEIIKEFGDMMFRGTVSLMVLFPDLTLEQITNEVSKHITTKLNKLLGYIKEGKYQGGI